MGVCFGSPSAKPPGAGGAPAATGAAASAPREQQTQHAAASGKKDEAPATATKTGATTANGGAGAAPKGDSHATGTTSTSGETKKEEPKKAAGHGSHSGGKRGSVAEEHAEFRERYQLKQVLGNGNYSVVREAIDKRSGDHVAVKCIDKKKLTQEDEDALKIETGILGEVSHPNIISLYGFYEESKNYYIVTELMMGGELFDRIVKKEFYSEEDAQKVVRTLGSAIKYCHDRGIVHRDLKPENILMKDQKDDAAIKIADFGFARKEADGLHTPCGTPGYVAPEIIKNEPYGREVDMWSLGVIIYILLSGYPPFYNQNQNQLFQQIRHGKYEFDSPYWDPISDKAKDLIRGLLVVDPKKRFTVDQMLAHPWVSGDVSAQVLTTTLSELKKFNARRKLRAGIKAALATQKFAKLLKKSPSQQSSGGDNDAPQSTDAPEGEKGGEKPEEKE